MVNLLRRRKRIAIFGSGPAGLFAAAAAESLGHVVEIYARGPKSPLYGAQYLHEPIPGLSVCEPRMVNYTLRGTAVGYRHKVYGPGSTVAVSPLALVGKHLAWDIREAYDNAWKRYADRISWVEIDPAWLVQIGSNLGADLVIWSIPLAPQCVQGHHFITRQVWAQGDAPDLGRFCSVSVEPFTVVCNGLDSPRWYRAANVFGYTTAEWPLDPKPPIPGLALVNKPIDTNCNCWATLGGSRVLRVGRYGRWLKGELSHQAYTRTREVLR